MTDRPATSSGRQAEPAGSGVGDGLTELTVKVVADQDGAVAMFGALGSQPRHSCATTCAIATAFSETSSCRASRGRSLVGDGNRRIADAGESATSTT